MKRKKLNICNLKNENLRRKKNNYFQKVEIKTISLKCIYFEYMKILYIIEKLIDYKNCSKKIKLND